MPMPRHPPSKIHIDKQTQTVEITFDAHTYLLSCEFLRVYSPSAEVRGHGKGQEVLQLNKNNVSIVKADMQGNYAIKFTFDDGHNSGVYSWDYLYKLATEKETLWDEYIQKVEAHKNTTATIKWVP